MNKEPETDEELIRKKMCIDLTKYYELSQNDLEQIYDFLEKNPKGTVKCAENISLINGNDTANAITIITKCINSTIDGIIMTNTLFNIIPHYTPTSYSGYSGGSSSNNNNNNNNNNNR